VTKTALFVVPAFVAPRSYTLQISLHISAGVVDDATVSWRCTRRRGHRSGRVTVYFHSVSFFPSLPISLSLFLSLSLSFARAFARSLVRPLARSFVRSFVSLPLDAADVRCRGSLFICLRVARVNPRRRVALHRRL